MSAFITKCQQIVTIRAGCSHLAERKEEKMNSGNLGYHLANVRDHERYNAGTATGRGPSPKIWADCPLLPILLDPTKGFVYFNDFLEAGGVSITANGSSNGITLTERTEGTIANDATVPGGILKIDSVNTTADQGATMQLLGVQCEPASGTTIWMEWRCKIDVGGGQCFMGLADDSSTAVVSSSDAIATDKDLVGFYRDAGTGDTDWTVGVLTKYLVLQNRLMKNMVWCLKALVLLPVQE